MWKTNIWTLKSKYLKIPIKDIGVEKYYYILKTYLKGYTDIIPWERPHNICINRIVTNMKSKYLNIEKQISNSTNKIYWCQKLLLYFKDIYKREQWYILNTIYETQHWYNPLQKAAQHLHKQHTNMNIKYWNIEK